MNKIKFLLCLALLVSGVEGRGQIYIDSYRFGGGGLLLDEFPNASSAHSLRLLDKDYTGNIITVRRTSNGDTSNIGILNNYLDTATLKTFCGSASTDTCYVRRWFDQSGNSNNLIQTTNSEQPRIITAGVLEKDGSTVSIKFDGINDNMEYVANNPDPANARISVFLVAGDLTYGSDNGRFFSLYGGTNTFQYLKNSVTNYLYTKAENYQTDATGAATEHNSQTAPTVKFLSLVISRTATANDLYINNALQNATAKTNAVNSGGTKGVIMARSDKFATTRLNGEMSEIIVYDSDKTSDRTQISLNINTFYSIY